LTSNKIIIDFLGHICDNLEHHLQTRSFIDEQGNSRISNCIFFISGGDKIEGYYLRQAISRLNSDEIDIPDEEFNDKNTLNLYKLLKNNVLILNPIFMMLPNKQEVNG